MKRQNKHKIVKKKIHIKIIELISCKNQFKLHKSEYS